MISKRSMQGFIMYTLIIALIGCTVINPLHFALKVNAQGDIVDINSYSNFKNGEDWAPAFQKALSEHSVINIPAGEYKSSEITVPSNKKIIGTGDETKFIPLGVTLFKLQGQAADKKIAISEDVADYSNTVKVTSIDNIKKGDLLLVKSLSNSMSPEEAGDNWTLGSNAASEKAVNFGEYIKVKDISGNTIIAYENTVFPFYKTNKSSYVQKVDAVCNTLLSSFSIIKPCEDVITMKYTSDCKVEKVNLKIDSDTSITDKLSFISFDQAMDSCAVDCNSVIGCSLNLPANLTADDFAKYNSNYNLFKTMSSKRSGFLRCFSDKATNAFDISYNYMEIPSIQSYVKDCTSKGSVWSGITVQQACYGSLINGNSISASPQGIKNAGRSTEIISNIIDLNNIMNKDYSYCNGIEGGTSGISLIEGYAVDCIVSANTILNVNTGLLVRDGDTASNIFKKIGAEVKNNTITKCLQGIYISKGSNNTETSDLDIYIHDNTITGYISSATTYGIRIYARSAGIKIDKNNISSSKYGIFLSDSATNINITGNQLSKMSSSAIYLKSTTANSIITAENNTFDECKVQYTGFNKVTFYDWNGTVLKLQYISKRSGGSIASEPVCPVRDGYTFIGWDRSLTGITANIEVTAQYTAKISDTDAVAADKAALNIVFADGDNAESVTKNLILTVTGSVYNSIISWESSDPSILSSSGIVNRPSHTSTDCSIILTATLNKNDVYEIKQFNVTVKKVDSNDVAAIMEDKNSLNIIYSNSDSALSVTESVYLSVTGAVYGSTITWKSSNTIVLTDTGFVYRPSNAKGDINIKLIATISRNGISDSKTFYLKVKCLPDDEVANVRNFKDYVLGDDWAPAFAQALSRYSKIYVPAGVYKSSEIKVPSDRQIFGDGDETKFIPLSDCLFRIEGHKYDEAAISKDIVDFSRKIELADIGDIKAGDTLILKSQRNCMIPEDAGEEWGLGASYKTGRTAFFGEYVEVSGIQGNSITTKDNILFPFYMSNGVNEHAPKPPEPMTDDYPYLRSTTTVQKIELARNAELKNFSVVNTSKLIITLKNAKDCRIEKVNLRVDRETPVVDNISFIHMSQAVDCVAYECNSIIESSLNIPDTPTFSQYSNYNLFKVISSTRSGFEKCYANKAGHAFNITYSDKEIPGIDCFVKDCTAEGCVWSGIAIQQSCFRSVIIGNKITNSAGGIKAGGRKSSITHNDIDLNIPFDTDYYYCRVSEGGTAGISLIEGYATDSVIEGNRIKNAFTGILIRDGNESLNIYRSVNTEIKNNDIITCVQGIATYKNADNINRSAMNLFIHNNNVSGMPLTVANENGHYFVEDISAKGTQSTYGIKLYAKSAGVKISDNIIGNAKYGVFFGDNPTNIDLLSNSFFNLKYGIRIKSASSTYPAVMTSTDNTFTKFPELKYIYSGFDNENVTINNQVGSKQTQDALISSAPVYSVIFKNWDGSILANKIVPAGFAVVPPSVTARSGYIFTGWDKAIDAVLSDLEVTAQYTEAPNEETNSSDIGIQQKTDTTVSKTENSTIATALIKVEVTANSEKRVVIDEEKLMESVKKAIEEMKKQGEVKKVVFEIELAAKNSGEDISIIFSEKALNIFGEYAKVLKVSTSRSAFTLNEQVIKSLLKRYSGEVELLINRGEMSGASNIVKEAVGGRPVYNYMLKNNGNIISDVGTRIEVAIAYSPNSIENVAALVIYNISPDGKIRVIPDSIYDSKTGTVKFRMDNLGQYAVGYNKVEFTDVEGWYKEYVDFLAARGIVTGNGQGIYNPEDSITRGEFIQMLFNLTDENLNNKVQLVFQDIKLTDWYKAAVQWASDNEIVKGYNGEFKPMEKIERQDFAVIINRYINCYLVNHITSNDTNHQFEDGSEVSDYAKEAISNLLKYGLISGDESNKFNPHAYFTRAEAAKIITLIMRLRLS